ncbi:LysM peptidoglycan-binding domain-containing protein [Parabacteroides sp. FAFU027]|uniref:LysM peptidoglycan-binding domain-containing protein n=1 Tax=Parabacteroides sp. FAFU027 TaxID=2922715 RepID=UPI001FAE88F9|nr:LysM peptidoglycan-binding domain-containing protein [Parabacteroides sp. FAFU027]
MIKTRLFVFSLFIISLSSFAAKRTPGGIKETIHDDAIQVPAPLTSNIDSLLSDWIVTNHLSLDEHCIQQSENPLFSDSIYIERLSKMPSVIEMPYNQVVRTYIDLYAGRLRERVSYMMGLSKFYFPLFEQALDAENMPLELKYLPVIESALNPAATSRVGAAGLWQFMIYTGKDYGLQIDNLIDERRDPIKSTYVAVRYLKALHRIYGDWNLAIAAYNCGPGNVNKAIRRSGGKRDYWEIYFNLPKETRGYVPAFIAVNYLMSYAKEHNICAAQCKLPVNSDTVQVNKMVHFQQIADMLNIPVEEVKILNPQYRKELIPGNIKPQTLRLPMASAYAYIEQEDTIAKYRSEEFLLNFRKTVDPGTINDDVVQTVIRHKVRKGESIYNVASRYGVSVSDIKSWNNLKSTKLKKNSLLAIYKEKRVTPVAPVKNSNDSISNQTASVVKEKTKAKSVSATTQYYKVKKGETLQEIAAKYDVSVCDLKKMNHLSKSKVSKGQLLAIKVEKRTKETEEKATLADTNQSAKRKQVIEMVDVTLHHKVKKGETLSEIADKYNVNTSDVKKWNHLKSTKLDRGDMLSIRTKEKRVKTVLVESKDLALKNKTVSKAVNDSISVDDRSNKFVSKDSLIKDFEYYRVRKGDTLWAIASKYPGTSVEQIMQANKMSRQDAIQVGMRIKIPKS